MYRVFIPLVRSGRGLLSGLHYVPILLAALAFAVPAGADNTFYIFGAAGGSKSNVELPDANVAPDEEPHEDDHDHHEGHAVSSEGDGHHAAHLSEDSETDASLDLYFSGQFYEHFTLTTEYFRNKEHGDLERLYLHWQIRESLGVGIGRWHNYVGYWNAEYNHGAYLSPSISRPFIEEYEDHGGIVAMHATGLFIEKFLESNRAQHHFDFSVGLTASVEGANLVPFDVLDGRPSRHGLSASLRYSQNSLEDFDNKWGVFVGKNDYQASENALVNDINQIYGGAFVNQFFELSRLISAVYVVSNELVEENNFTDEMTAAYLHYEYFAKENIMIYGRAEGSFKTFDHLEKIFPSLYKDKAVVGLKINFLKKHAVNFESIYGKTLSDIKLTTFSFEWSFVLP